jgi:hypothetical protein
MRDEAPNHVAALLTLKTAAARQPAAVSCTLKSDNGDTIGYYFVPAAIDVIAEVRVSKNGFVHRHDPNPPLWSTRPAFTNQPLLVATSRSIAAMNWWCKFQPTVAAPPPLTCT